VGRAGVLADVGQAFLEDAIDIDLGLQRKKALNVIERRGKLLPRN
jgi:hypothetical protein